MKKRAVAQGFSDLFQSQPEGLAAVLELPVSEVYGNPLQPRRRFDEEKLRDLASSIEKHGIVQPVVVTREIEGYRLVVGERRLRAARLAGLETIPALVKEMAGQKLLEVALIENLQREDLNPVEEAQAFSYLIREHKLTQEELANRLGCSRPAVSNALRLLTLPPVVRQEVEAGCLSAGHARAALALPTEHQQIRAWNEMKAQEMSVRQAEEFVRQLLRGKERSQRARPSLTADWAQIQEHLGVHLNTIVKIRPAARGRGRIELSYENQDDLERLVEYLIYHRLDG